MPSKRDKDSSHCFKSSTVLEEWPSQAFFCNCFQALALQEVVGEWLLIALSDEACVEQIVPLGIKVLLSLNFGSNTVYFYYFFKK
jgi:hypothetical protein